MRLEGKVALITGAGSGIGRATAMRFAAEGAQTVAVDIADSVDDTVAEVLAAGGKLREQRRDSHPQVPEARTAAHAMWINGDPVQEHDHWLVIRSQ